MNMDNCEKKIIILMQIHHSDENLSTNFVAMISPNFSVENVNIRVWREGVNFDYSMSLSVKEGVLRLIWVISLLGFCL